MKFSSSIVKFSVEHPKIVVTFMTLITAVFVTLAVLPTLWPQTFPSLNPLKVDTDPENMLPKDEAVRVFHNRMKKELSLHEIVVLGIVNESHPAGVFNPESLKKIYELTEYAKTLSWPDKEHPDKENGVIEVDIIAPSTVDNIEQGGLGTVKFEWLMPTPPKTEEEALSVRHKAERIPFLNGTVLSEDGKALCVYLPLTSKDVSHKVYTKLREKIATLSGSERYFVTGLPVAEDTFGVEMFQQMAVSAPLAMFVIFLLMLFFFRKLVLIISPLIIALVSVICTMGLLIATGNTVHIMSSMIPIFIMPIAVLDAVHILSEFFDRYQKTNEQRTTIINVMDTLFSPMLYTSLTTFVGFASLALTPIPPVRVFGIFVAFGVLIAWVWTVTFIPAYVMLIPEKYFKGFGVAHGNDAAKSSAFARFLPWLGHMTLRNAKAVMVFTFIIAIIAVYGITKININDNPTKWFPTSHPIRVADKVLNEHFGGTYMGYLELEPEAEGRSLSEYSANMLKRMTAYASNLDMPGTKAIFDKMHIEAKNLTKTASSKEELWKELEKTAELKAKDADDDKLEAWDEVLLFIDIERQREEVFKQPEALRYVAKLQKHLLTTGIVGKSNSIADIVKTVHRELLLGKAEEFKIPKSSDAVAQCLITYQNSHRPQDLWHFVTPDYKKTSIWVQLRSGDNSDMSKVVKAVENYTIANPPPFNLKPKWFGLTYINVIWQDKMVKGMLNAFLGSFVIVLIMMVILFRSFLWGILSMIPLTVTIGSIYGVIGLIGKDYDMPTAVLSSLSLGLAVDYAIHFLARTRKLYEEYGSWSAVVTPVFGEPARAITRNVVVVGVGFLPLLAASLVPYKTVGIFITAILLTAGAASIIILPSIITLLEPWLFKKPTKDGINVSN